VTEDREEREIRRRQAALAEHVYVEPDSESEDRHVVFQGRRVGKLVWNSEDRWDLFLATADGYVFGTLSYHPGPDLERIDRDASGHVAYMLAAGMHPLSEEGL